jgi:hypothetical protein
MARPGDPRTLHVLSFHWDGFEPTLLAWNDSKKAVEGIDLGKLDICVTTSRRCVGSFDGEDYFPCPSGRAVGSPFAQCQQCAGPHIPDQQCTFEPKCDGSRCGARFCSREHTVYLAFHGALAKVGMCGGHRVAERLVEQGADAYAVVAAAPNRLEARRLESEISKRLKLRQRVLARESLAHHASGQPWERIEESWAAISERLEAELGAAPGPLRRLDGYPLAQPLPSAPRLRQTIGPHSGRVVGIKGRHMIYENEGLNALDLSDLPARVVKLKA